MSEYSLNLEVLCKAGNLMQQGELVAFPTETVYGLGGNALNPEASRKIYAAKGRPSDNPLIIHIANLEALDKIVTHVPSYAKKLAAAYWPGPLTMIFHKSEIVPDSTTGGMDTVAVRMPNNKIALELIKQAGGYVAAPSANTSGRPSPTRAAHVYTDMKGKIPLIIDGGPVGIGIESTIVDITQQYPMVLRPGHITKEMLEKTLGCPVILDPAMFSVGANQQPRAPGMKYKHYAPKAELTIVTGRKEDVENSIIRFVREKEDEGFSVGVICTDESITAYEGLHYKSIGLRKDEHLVAHNLFGVLRAFDEEDVDFIYSEAFSEKGVGQAIMNRLSKAAGQQIINASSQESADEV